MQNQWVLIFILAGIGASQLLTDSTNIWQSNSGDFTITSASNGQIVAARTTEGFSWLIAQNPADTDLYVTLICATSTVDFGPNYFSTCCMSDYSCVTNGPTCPLLGDACVGALTDPNSLFYSYIPPNTETVDPQLATLGQTYQYDFYTTQTVKTYPGQSEIYSFSGDSNLQMGFEVLDAGSAIWCVQTLAQVGTSAGNCDDGVTTSSSCQSTTRVSYVSQVSCATSETLYIYNSDCFSTCPNGTTQSSSLIANISACTGTASLTPCSSPCSTCITNSTTCTACLTGYYQDSGTNTCTPCPSIGYFPSTTTQACDSCDSSCYTCNGETANNCTSCTAGGSTYLYQSMCTSCPFGYGANDTLAVCIECSSTQLWYNSSCLDTCPDGYVATNSGGCGKCSNTNLIYYNHTCVSSCPLTTFSALNEDDNENECQPCYLGCDICENGTSSGCLSCSAGFYYLDSTCNTGCPANMYADPQSRMCEQCQQPCLTCSQPNNLSCTSCPSANYLLNGTCVTSCPADYYENFFSAENGTYQVAACFPKLILSFNLSLTTDACVINIKFNYGIVDMILSISENILVQINNTQIDNVLFVLSPLTESSIQFEYLGDQYYPPLSLLNITIDLDTTDFNNNAYQQFQIINKTATIQLKEIYPFTETELQFISSSSSFTGYGGTTIAATQAVSSITEGGLSLGLVRMEIVGETIQLMRFINIRWPANVAQYYSTSKIDPSSIVLPIDFTESWNDQLSDRNYSIPRIFDEYEISPFFSENYNNELSNLMLLCPFVIIGSCLFYILKKTLRKMTQEPNLPKTNARKKFRDHYIILVHKLSRFMNRNDDSFLWNFSLMFILSIYQSGNLWALLNIRYSSALLEPSTFFTKTTLGVGIIFFIFYLLLACSIFRTISSNLNYDSKQKSVSDPYD